MSHKDFSIKYLLHKIGFQKIHKNHLEMSSVEHLKQSLDSMVTMLESNMNIVNTCMVDFIVKDMFNILSPKLQEELLQLSDDQLTKLASILFQDQVDDEDYWTNLEVLSQTLHTLRSLRMETLNIVSDADLSDEENMFQHWDTIMTQKKTHEVEIMSQMIKKHVKELFFDWFINQTVQSCNCHCYDRNK